MKGKHLVSIDMLRGVVTLMVCLYHFTEGFFLETEFLRQCFSRAYLGVEIFFVISGFVIPYTMFKGNYELKDGFRFIIKRLLRIEPPYWLSIALIFIIDYVSTFFRHYKDKAINLDLADLFSHLLHLNDFLDKPWLKGIYWSLAIEIQYYLLIALIFPLLCFKNQYLTWIVLLLFCLGRWTNMEESVFYYGCHFTIGLLLFNAHIGSIGNKQLLFGLITGFIITYWCFDVYHLTAVSLSALFIYYMDRAIPPLVFLGKISYSFYLIHIHVGWTLIDAMLRTTPDGNRILFLIVGIMAAILSSWFFYEIIEKPSHKWSNAVNLKSENINRR